MIVPLESGYLSIWDINEEHFQLSPPPNSSSKVSICLICTFFWLSGYLWHIRYLAGLQVALNNQQRSSRYTLALLYPRVLFRFRITAEGVITSEEAGQSEK